MNTTLNPLGIVLFADNRERLPNGTISFGELEIDDTGTLEFRVRNRSDVAVTITDITLLQADAYSLVGESSFEFPLTLEPSEEFEFAINVFSETQQNELFDFLRISSSVAGAPLDYRLMSRFGVEEDGPGPGPDPDPGTGLGELALYYEYFDPVIDEIDLGSLSNFSSPSFVEILLIIENVGTEPLVVSSIELLNNLHDIFSLETNPAPVTIPVGGTESFILRATYNDVNLTSNLCVLQINHNGVDGPYTIPVLVYFQYLD